MRVAGYRYQVQWKEQEGSNNETQSLIDVCCVLSTCWCVCVCITSAVTRYQSYTACVPTNKLPAPGLMLNTLHTNPSLCEPTVCITTCLQFLVLSVLSVLSFLLHALTIVTVFLSTSCLTCVVVAGGTLLSSVQQILIQYLSLSIDRRPMVLNFLEECLNTLLPQLD